MKTKFTSADVRAVVGELVNSNIIGSRVVNVYDVSQRSYILKLSNGSEKIMLFIDSGFRFHTTKFQRTLPDSPSPFAMILRKLRKKRLDSATQLGFDRVVDLRFSGGDGVRHLLLEFYAGGNIVLTDENYEVIALLRSHQFSEEVVLKVGEIYPVAYSTQLALQTKPDNWNQTIDHPFFSFESFQSWLAAKIDQIITLDAAAAKEGKRKGKAPNLRQLLLSKESGVSYLGPEFLDHAIQSAGLKTNQKLEQLRLLTAEDFTALSKAIGKSLELIEGLKSHANGGFIILGTKVGDSDDIPFEEFTPVLLHQHENVTSQHHTSFNDAVDTYFYRIEDQKIQKELQAKEEAARKKLQKVQDEHDRMLQSLSQQQRDLEDSALLLEMFADKVDKAALVINSALSAELTWSQIQDMVDMETQRGNPIAGLISRLKLADNIIVLRFARDELLDPFDVSADDEDDEEDKERGAGQSDFLEVEIDLALSAHANVSRLYTTKKATRAKEVKTITASVKAMENIKQQAAKTLENSVKKVSSIAATRKVHWFEKFHWFITSEGFLVLSGKDAHQNDQLIRRYLKAEDVYVHADVNGAASCLVKAQRRNSEDVQGPAVLDAQEKFFVTPLAIQEAGAYAVCRSRAWTAKLITSSYWVRAAQVSKTAPSGEFLPTGSFMIYGKKNYLPPMPLEMGFGLLFRLGDEDSVARHAKERKIRSYDVDSETASTIFQSAEERYGLDSGMNQILSGSVVEENEEEDGEDQKKEDAENGEEGGDVVEKDEEEDDDIASKLKLVSLSEEETRNEEEKEAVEEDDEEEEQEPEEETIVVPPPMSKKQQKQLQQKTKGSKDGKGGQSSKKSGKKNQQDEDTEGDDGRSDNEDTEYQRSTKSSSVTSAAQPPPKKKTLNKKKARRYAEQDDEDRELAMLVLGHAAKSTGETLQHVQQKQAQQHKQQDLASRQQKAGVNLLQQQEQQQQRDLQSLLEAMGGPEAHEVQAEWRRMIVDEQLLTAAEIAESEVRALSVLPTEQALEALARFRDVLISSASSTATNDHDEAEGDNNDVNSGNRSKQVPGQKQKGGKHSAQSKERAHGKAGKGGSFASNNNIGEGGKGSGSGTLQNKSSFLAGILRRLMRSQVSQGHVAHVRKAPSSSSSAAATTKTAADTPGKQEEDVLHDDAQREEDEDEDEDEATHLQQSSLANDWARLTGCPLPEDTILYAVPMCGPYLSMQGLKYKVKLTPGTIKKGKAVKTAVDLFSRSREASSVEQQAMKALTDPELVGCMIGEVKLSMPGLQQQKQQLKSQKKKGGRR